MNESHSVVSNSLQPNGLYSPWNSPDQNNGVEPSLLQGIFPAQGSSPGLPHCRRIPYQLSHKGSPRILEWVAYPFSSGSSRPRNWTRVSCIAGRFFSNWKINYTSVKFFKIKQVFNKDKCHSWELLPIRSILFPLCQSDNLCGGTGNNRSHTLTRLLVQFSRTFFLIN